MRPWSAEQLARAAGAQLIDAPPAAGGPERVVIDSRQAGAGALFAGLKGRGVDGGRFARQALGDGAWGTLTTADYAAEAREVGRGVVLAADDPLAALQRLATAWRRELGADVIGVTGSTGKTSTKDLLLAVLGRRRRTIASRANYNTEIGVPLEILSAPIGTEVLVLEMAMRGSGQIAELAAIAEPGVAVIVSIGPAHLELLGTIEAVAAAKAELIAALPPGGTAVVPAGEALLDPHRREDVSIITFGKGGDVQLGWSSDGRVEIVLGQERISLEVDFTQAHLRQNLLAAVAAARAIGVLAEGRIELSLSAGRGQRVALPDEVTLIDDCYNANPVSMRAALEDLAAFAGREHRRRVAVLGDMLELGPGELEFHRDAGRQAAAAGVDVLLTVGPLAAAISESFDGEVHRAVDAREAAGLLGELLRPGDVVLVKGSRGVGLELVCRALGAPNGA
jgi:UDP-N-acetylmuramoyl-tripeptide--D-alanyl-D-alanine ligase